MHSKDLTIKEKDGILFFNSQVLGILFTPPSNQPPSVKVQSIPVPLQYGTSRIL